MKLLTLIIFTVGFTISAFSQTGRVGIGITTPAALLHVNGEGVLFTATTQDLQAFPPVQGSGIRMMWFGNRGAFRAGRVTGTHWDRDSIGQYSSAFGYNSKASGIGSFAANYGSSATGNYATSIGFNNSATSSAAVALGSGNSATGIYSVAMGVINQSTAAAATTAGLGNQANGDYAVAMGDQNVANGEGSVAMGTANYTYALRAVAMGAGNVASGEGSFAVGGGNTASGLASTAIGNLTNASGMVSFASGYGSIAPGNWSFSAGFRNTGLGDMSAVFGQYNLNRSVNSLVAGAYNDTSDITTNPASGAANDRLFQLGNGDAGNRRNALTVLKNGNMGLDNVPVPNAPLAFSNALGKKITLYGNSAATQYGFGVTGGLLQIFSDAAGADIGLGYGSSSSFIERMRVKGNGMIGMGTNNPVKELEVIGAGVSTIPTLRIGSRNGFGTAIMEFVSDYGLSTQWRPGYIKTNDLGNFTGVLEFYTNGTGSANLNSSVKAFEVRSGIAYTATGTVSAYSDARLKHNLLPFTDGLNVIKSINPVLFNYNDDAPFKTDKQQVGIIAQELEKIAPYMIDSNKVNGYNDLRSVNNQAYTFLLINAIKEQQQQLDKQQAEIDALKNLVQSLINNK